MINLAQDFSVIICAYTEERWRELLEAIASIQSQSIQPREIILVIDHNTHLFERAQTYIPGIHIIENEEPKGLSGARNSGVKQAQGALIAFLDDDAVAEPDWLERLGDCCQDPGVLGAGGVVEPLWSGKRPIWFPKEFYWVIGCTYLSLSNIPLVVRNPYGGCICIRREVFEAVGGFRNGVGRIGQYPAGGEETELCIRALQHWPGKVFLCDPNARIHHHIPVNRTSWRYFWLRCYAEGQSKALIARYVGSRDSLASERSYTFTILPRGVARGLANGLRYLDAGEFMRVGAIVCGLAFTVFGYAVGMLSQ